MNYRISEVLNAATMRLPLFCGGTTFVGIGVTGTWTGTLTFRGSTDGINFVPITVTPFPSGTGVQTATANGNWFVATQNYLVVAVTAAPVVIPGSTGATAGLLTGSAVVTLCAAPDSSWQDAFLAATSKYVSQKVASGAANAVTIAAQANRAWRLRSLSVGFSVAASAAVDVQVSDGASSILWEGYVPPSLNGISGGGTFSLPIPPVSDNPTGSINGGIVGTPGNSMVITCAAPGGSVTSVVNAELVAA